MRSRRFTLVCLSALSLCAPLLAQTAPAAPEVWPARAKRLTEEIVGDAATLPALEAAFVYARLAGAWQKDDPVRARAWMAKAVEAVVSASREGADERRRRTLAARALLRLAAQVAPFEGQRLSELLRPEEGVSGRERAESATALAEAALALVESDPRRAAALGSASLRAGVSHRLSALLWRLRARDAALSDALFGEAAVAARAARSYQYRNLVAVLLHVAFEGPSPAEAHQRRALAVLAEGILQPPAPPDDERERCQRAAEAAPWLGHYARLLPQHEAPLQAALARCRQLLTTVTPELADRPRPSTVEDLLRASEETSDDKLRTEYLMRAAVMAAEQRDHERAINILDRVSLLARPGLGDSWEDLRWGYAVELAHAQLKRGDYQGVQRTIEAVPPAVRPFAQLSLAGRALKEKDRAHALEFTRAARRGVERLTPAAAAQAHLPLVRLYANLSPDEITPMLNEMARAINHAARSTPAGAMELSGAAPLMNDLVFASYSLPPSLIDIDEQGVASAVASVEPPAVRAALRLSLLAEALKLSRAARRAAGAGKTQERPHAQAQPR